MKWLATFVLLAQSPFLLIAFVAGGTDGKLSSLIGVWSVVIPIAACSLYTLYILHFKHLSALPDKLAMVLAFLPTIFLLVAALRKALS